MAENQDRLKQSFEKINKIISLSLQAVIELPMYCKDEELRKLIKKNQSWLKKMK